MLSERQQKIVEYLIKKELTGEELASRLQVSSRTILRDIGELNYFLQKNKIGVILSDYSGEGYFLRIEDPDNFEKLVHKKQSLRNDLLLLLCFYREVKMIDFQEQLFVSKPVIVAEIKVLKQLFKEKIRIVSRPARGYFIAEDYSTKLFISSQILKENEAGLSQKVKIETEKLIELKVYLQMHFQEWRQFFPFLNVQEFYYLLVAATKIEIDQESLKNERIFSEQAVYLQNLINSTRWPINKPQTQALFEHFNKLAEQSLNLTESKISEAIKQTEEIYRIDFKQEMLSHHLLMHIQRSLVFPSIVNSVTDELITLIDMNPLIYDYSNHFIRVLETQGKIKILDPDYIFLYFLSYKNNEKSMIKIDLYSSRWSVATINKRMIEDELVEAQVNCLVEEEPSELSEESFIIWNKEAYQSQSKKAHFQFEGIIDSEQMKKLKVVVAEETVKKVLTEFFVETCSFKQMVQKNETWIELIKKCCERLVKEKKITKEVAQQLINREQQGNSLIVNHIGIPHVASNQPEFFSLFHFQLAEPIKQNGSKIYHLLIVLVNPTNKENNQVFPYLYKKINTYTEKEISQLLMFSDIKNSLI